ncbi:hypothetical protein AAEY27_19000 [Kosakonia sp. BYX6]|uniref:Lipoprotein n=1 Tax=Kosakonia calanthes TaxID=3139408 RepID=A0ABZ3B4E8_9ENTR
MKWHPAKPTKRALFLLLFALLALACGYVLRSGKTALTQAGEISQQFGFYDLMLQKHELYDSRMSTLGNMIVSTISSPLDADFVLKGNFVHSRLQGGKYYFSYTPVFFTPSKDSRMITNNVDLLVNSQIWMQQIKPDGVPLVNMQNGMIFFYPLEAE